MWQIKTTIDAKTFKVKTRLVQSKYCYSRRDAEELAAEWEADLQILLDHMERMKATRKIVVQRTEDF